MTNEAADILIVDDEPALRQALRRIFRLHAPRWTIAEAAGGAEALARLAAGAPDLILLDVAMPGMSGFEVCEQIACDARNQRTPIIMISGRDDTADKIRGMATGACDYVTKPFDDAELIARIAVHLRIKRLESQLVRRKELEAALKTAVALNHEIVNPITGIVGSLELLRQTPQSAENQALVDQALELTLRVDGVVKQLLAMEEFVTTAYDAHSEMAVVLQEPRDADATK